MRVLLVRRMIGQRTVRWAGSTRSRDRGDVPGWVLITVMTAGLVAALWAIAGPTLAQMLTDALASVSG